MKTTLSLLLLAAAAPLLAQDAKPAPKMGAVASLGGSFSMVSGYIAKAADQVPEADYAFKPTPEVRSFGQLVGHVADAQNTFCSKVLGVANPAPDIEKKASGKAELVAALKASTEFCAAAYKLPDAETHGMIKLFGHDMPKFTGLMINVTHDWEHYGNIVTYMRLKGMTPPSSQPGAM